MRLPHLRGRGPNLPILDQIVQYEMEPGYVTFMVPSPKRIRAQVGDILVADTIAAMIMLESDHLPIYYLPIKDVREEFLRNSATLVSSTLKGDAVYFSLDTGAILVKDAGWRYLTPLPGCPSIADFMAFHWDKIDHWFEEDEEVFVHARDPYKRVDCLRSSRHVQVVVGGELVAETRRGTLLFETGTPTRYYMPFSDIRLNLLDPSRTVSRCPYKGTASYYNLTVGDKRLEDLVWYYPEPTREVEGIKGLLSFYNEFVDAIYVDGVEQPKPDTAATSDLP